MFKFRALSLAAACAVVSLSAAAQQGTVKIGLITDMTGLYADLDGPAGVEAIRMAVADFGGSVNGKKIEVLSADHLNKADLAATKAREWMDQQGLNLLIGGANSAANLAMAKVVQDKKRPFISIGAATARMTNEDCTPYTIHYAYDTVALARGTGAAMVKQGGKDWYFLTADYAFGHSLEKDTSDVVKTNGGKVIGATRFPLNASDFSSFLLQAQASKAKVLGLATAGGDTVNAIKAANEFGLVKTMNLAGLLMFEPDIHSLGLKLTQGMYLTAGWYWDMNAETRAWSKRFFEKIKRMPTMLQAANYSATLHYLNAARAVGSEDPDKVMAKMRETKINDLFAKGGYVRPDGRMVHDMLLMQVKKPEESKYPWDYYKIVATIPGEQAFANKAESKCPLWK